MLTLPVGIVRSNQRREQNQIRVGPSCVRLVSFIRKSTEFHVMRMECQIIIFHFLLLISHKSPAVDKRCHILIFLIPVFNQSPITTRSLCNNSPITPHYNDASVYPPVFDTLE